MRRLELEIDGRHPLTVWAAETPVEIATGLRGLASFPRIAMGSIPGMLLPAFRRGGTVTMSGVRFPIDVAFLDAGRVLGVHELEVGAPDVEIPVGADGVLELPARTCRLLGIGRGSTVMAWS